MSVYTGPAGMALASWRLARVFPQRHAHFHAAALQHIKLALTHVRELSRELTFLMGAAGVHCVAAAVLPAADAAEHVQAVLGMLPRAVDAALAEDELLYGRVGYLYALLFLSRLPAAAPQAVAAQLQAGVQQVAQAVLRAGARLAPSSAAPLMYEWHGKRYLGAAHGLIGILYVLLDVPQLLADPPTRALLQATLDWLLTQRTASGNWATKEVAAPPPPAAAADELVQWCHGAVGAAQLFARAYRLFKHERYAGGARAAAEHVWAFGLVRKGPGLCHGVAGNAYAFLALYAATGEPLQLQRARHFAAFMLSERGRSTFTRPDHPHSLMEGSAGAVCFLADLLRPARAAFPAFDLEPP